MYSYDRRARTKAPLLTTLTVAITQARATREDKVPSRAEPDKLSLWPWPVLRIEISQELTLIARTRNDEGE